MPAARGVWVGRLTDVAGGRAGHGARLALVEDLGGAAVLGAEGRLAEPGAADSSADRAAPGVTAGHSVVGLNPGDAVAARHCWCWRCRSVRCSTQQNREGKGNRGGRWSGVWKVG